MSPHPLAPTARHHACDACGFTFRDSPWPQGCPNCHAPAHWIASHHTAEGARLHVPLLAPGEARS